MEKPTGLPKTTDELLKKFTVAENGCHEWTASYSCGGYGQIHRRINGRSLLTLAHRLQWEHRIGPIPKGFIVMHRCDNRACINIDHLILGIHQANMDDMWRKGRHPGTRRPFGTKRKFLKEYRRTEEASCSFCSATFMAVTAERKRGRGLFCGRSCAASAVNRRRDAA